MVSCMLNVFDEVILTSHCDRIIEQNRTKENIVFSSVTKQICLYRGR